MRNWFQLYKKELYAISFFMLVVISFILAWHLFLFYKSSVWPFGLTFGLSFIPFSFFPLMILWMGYNSFRREWKDETIYFMFSLPRPGWQLSLSKLLAGMTLYTAVTIFTLILIYLTQQDFIQTVTAEMPAIMSNEWIVENIIKLTIVYLLIGVVSYIMGQFSQLISQFYDRFRGLISIVVFVLSSYLIYRGGSFIAPLFDWAPDIPVRAINDTFSGMQEFTIYLGTGPLLGSALIILALFIGGSWLLEKHLEV